MATVSHSGMYFVTEMCQLCDILSDRNRDSVFGIATLYGLEVPGIEFR
jgi:hypothetical protein